MSYSLIAWKKVILVHFLSKKRETAFPFRILKSHRLVPPLPQTFLVVVQLKMAAGSLQAANEKDKLPERVVLWDETEVAKRQVNQVGTSACGATAVLNVLVRRLDL